MAASQARLRWRSMMAGVSLMNVTGPSRLRVQAPIHASWRPRPIASWRMHGLGGSAAGAGVRACVLQIPGFVSLLPPRITLDWVTASSASPAVRRRTVWMPATAGRRWKWCARTVRPDLSCSAPGRLGQSERSMAPL